MAFFSRLFGPSAFAIDFSDRSLRLLALRGMRVRASAYVEVPEGVIEHAEIKDQEAVSELLRGLVNDASGKKLSAHHVIAGIPEAQVFSMHITVPNEASGEALDQLVLKQAADLLPFTLDMLAWDYTILSTGETDYNILFVAAQKEIVQGYVNTVMLAGLDLIALEPEATSLTRALVSKSMVTDDKAVAIIDIGGRGSRLVFADRLGQQLAVSKPIGGGNLTEALAKKKKISITKAEREKIKLGMSGAVKGIAETVYEPLVAEFLKAQAFYEGKTHRKVTQVVLSGGAGQMEGLNDFFQKTIALPVILPQSTVLLDDETPATMAVLTGLALRSKKPKSGLSFVIPD